MPACAGMTGWAGFILAINFIGLEQHRIKWNHLIR
jgi:hypothetical protein